MLDQGGEMGVLSESEESWVRGGSATDPPAVSFDGVAGELWVEVEVEGAVEARSNEGEEGGGDEGEGKKVVVLGDEGEDELQEFDGKSRLFERYRSDSQNGLKAGEKGKRTGGGERARFF
jgi:hypothetical protein